MPRGPGSSGWDTTEHNYAPATPRDDPEDISMSDGEAVVSYPPPHIAARFYRDKPTRKKSSATSSRRNSMTSLTSQRSNRSNRPSHGGVQSAHVAQHLRRISIIESRKARFADRAAHAEAVRLRAALAKAAPRTSTASEARAAAAQAAREKYLAQVVANCAEEVKRAKKIAEEMKEKKAAEHLKLKEDMQERLADAERRRVLYQQSLKRSRPVALPVVEESRVAMPVWRPSNDAAAARCIQRAWRRSRGNRIIEEFTSLDLIGNGGKDRSFDDWTTLVAREDAISKTSRILQLYGIVLSESRIADIATRTFLSSFLMLEHPSETIGKHGPLEDELQAQARDMQSAFVRLHRLNTVKYSPDSITTSFPESFARFTTTFAAWKQGNASSLVDGLLAQFAELDAIWQTVKDDVSGGVADDYKEGIQRNQALLIVRLKRLLGKDEALKRLHKAVKHRRNLKAPRQMETINRLSENLNLELPGVEDIASHATPNGQAANPGNLYRQIHLRNLLSLTDPLPENRIVVHELLIDRAYVLKVQPRTARWDEAMKRVFAGMQADLEAGKESSQIVYIAQSIRSQLLRMMHPKKPQYALVSETLDPQHIENQVKNGSFSYEKFFNFMNGVLPQLCAPFRDAAIKALAKNHNADLIERLLSLMHTIRILSVDYANHILQAFAPQMIMKAGQYERDAFAVKMKTCRLDKTRRWWHEAREKTIADASRRPPNATSSSHPNVSSLPASASNPSADRIYTQGLVTLFIAPHPLPGDALPETLELDAARIERIRGDVLHIISIATILLTAKNLLKREARTPWTAVFNQMWALPAPYADSPGSHPYRSVVELSHVLPEHVKPALDGAIRRVLGEARSAQEGDGDEGEGFQQPVMRVLLGKLKEHVLQRLGADSEVERRRIEGRVGEALGGVGLVEAVQRIDGIVGEMGRVKACDWEGHGEWISQVAKAEAAVEGAGMGA